MVKCNYCGVKTGDEITCCSVCAKKEMKHTDDYYKPSAPPKEPYLTFDSYMCSHCGYVISKEQFLQSGLLPSERECRCGRTLRKYRFIKARQRVRK